MFFSSSGRVSNPAKGVYGAGAHSDYGLITLLATDDVVGLQVIQLTTILFLCLSWLCFDLDLPSEPCRYVRTGMLSLKYGNM